MPIAKGPKPENIDNSYQTEKIHKGIYLIR